MKLGFFIGAATALNNDCTTPDAGIRCNQSCQDEMFECAQNCLGDSHCLAECNRVEFACFDDCPCYTNCLEGCPCTTEQGKKFCSNEVDMIVVSPSQHSIMVDVDSEQVLVKWGPTPAENSVQKLEFANNIMHQNKMCGFMMKGDMYLVGGNDDKTSKQAFRLKHGACEFETLPDLTFKFSNGRCTSVDNGDRAMLCGALNKPKDCHIYETTGISTPAGSTFESHTAGDFVEAAGKVFAIAGRNFRVELYNKTSKIWYMLTEDMSPLFPAEQKSFSEFTAAWIGGKVYTFGGEIIRDGNGASFSQTDIVYTMDIDTYKWSTYGQRLLQHRAFHRGIVSGANVMLISGDTKSPHPFHPRDIQKSTKAEGDAPTLPAIEKWTWNGSGFDQVLEELEIPLGKGDFHEVLVTFNPELYSSCIKKVL